MRIIGGTLKGRLLQTPDGYDTTRPTADRAKEGLFNMLSARLAAEGKTWEETVFFDGFAGSGAMGAEALSRGARHVFFAEKDKRALACIQKNLRGIRPSSYTLFGQDILFLPKKEESCPSPDILFLDAPYGKGLWEAALKNLLQKGWIAPKTLCIAETETAGFSNRFKTKKEKTFSSFPEQKEDTEAFCKTNFPKELTLLEQRSYGRPVFLFFKLREQ